MGDPIRIVENLTQKSIMSITFDNEDNCITVSTEDYKILFYDLHSILDEDLQLKINLNNTEKSDKGDKEEIINRENESKLNLLVSYMTKKTTILSMKYTHSNVLLTLGRFDDNDPKIFM